MKLETPVQRLKQRLESLYARYNRRDLVDTDPLGFLYRYDDPADREIAGLVASSLAYGRVALIRKNVEWVLQPMGRPALFLQKASKADLSERYREFRHRFTGGRELTALLMGIKRVNERHGSLKNCFLAGLRAEDKTVLPALERFVEELADVDRASVPSLSGGKACLAPATEGAQNGPVSAKRQAAFLLTSPADGSACKRMNLFLRWMVRKDAVDPGGWEEAGAHRLVIPLDTHLFRICRALGLTQRNQANLRAALDITESFRAIAPGDPIKYDFAISRLGILREAGLNEFLESCGVRETSSEPGAQRGRTSRRPNKRSQGGAGCG